MIGCTVSHYHILEKLGEGGMGAVYLAQDTVLDRKVALKFLPETTQQDPIARKRFLQEAKAAASLNHPYICSIHEIGEAEGKSFIVMEYVAGENLMEKLEKGPLPLKQALRLTSEVAEALEVAHEKGIVHRDLKPANVMLTLQGHAKIMDFGLAKQVLPVETPNSQQETLTAMTAQGTILGTLAYMSPEQARGETVDSRSDIFSFGVLLYETVSGGHPFKRSSGLETMSSILRDPPQPLQKALIKTPSGLDRILTKALAKDRSQRYQTMHDLVVDIRELRERVTQQERRASLPWLGAAVVLTLALLVGVWWLAQRGSPPVKPAATTAKIVSVLLADFQNGTGETVFDRALEQAMAISLEGAPFITSYDRGRARRVAGQIRPGASALDGEMAQLVAQREGISLVLAGSIVREDAAYEISVEVFDTLTRKAILRRKAEAKAKDNVLDAVGTLAEGIRSALGDTPPASAQLAAETFTAASLEAAQNYALAQELQGEGKWEEAIRNYSRAVALDPDLGRAYAGLAVMHRNLGRTNEAERYYQMAMARIDRMTDRERYRTRGGYYVTIHNYLKAIEEFHALVNRYPADFVGHSNLALSYFLGRNMPQAVEEGRKTVEIYPKNVVMRSNLALYAMYSSNFDVAMTEASSVLKVDPSYTGAYLCLALSELASGRPAKAAETYRKMQGVSAGGASLAASGLADLALYEGQLSPAAAILEKGIAEDIGRNETEAAAGKLAALASTHLARGDIRLAVTEADRAVAMSRVDRVLFEAARLYLEAGQKQKALKIASELGSRIHPEPQLYAKLIEGEIKLADKQSQAALKLFLEAQALSDAWLARFYLGRAYLQAGAYTEAHSELEFCLKRRGEVAAVFLDDLPTYRYLPPVYYYLGRAQEGLRSPAAAESYTIFLAIQEQGGGPLVADARRRLSSISSK